MRYSVPIPFSRCRKSRCTVFARSFKPRLELLEARATPASIFATGAGFGGGPQVNVYNGDAAILASFFAFDPGFNGGVHVATADVNGDGVTDIIAGAGEGGGPHVKIIDGNRINELGPNNVISDAALLGSFFAYAPSFTGGVYVAGGDTNGDGKADVITGPGFGGGPQVKVIDATKLGMVDGQNEISDAALLQNFYAYSPQFFGGVRVASGDVNGDKKADIVTGAGFGGGPHVVVFDGTNVNNVLRSFFAFPATYTGGVYVAAGDVNGDSKADLFVGQGATISGPAHVRKFDGATGSLVIDFVPDNWALSARVATADVDNDGLADLLTANGQGLSPVVNSFNGKTLDFIGWIFAYSPCFLGGVFVG